MILRRRLAPSTAAILLIALAALVGPSRTLGAKDFPPPPKDYVFDEPDWLDAATERGLARILASFEDETSNQIVVAIFRSLEGEDLADYSQRLAERWAIGRADRDNGILLAIFAEDRLVDIEVGYGLEGAVTDLIAAEIRDRILVPAFRAGDRAGGILRAVEALMAASRGEYEGTGRRRKDDNGFPFWLLPFLFIVLFGGGRGRRSYLGPLILANTLRGGGGGFGGGGFGGGGFSGGGGSFGGGGARGGW